jgi:membrane-associated phospholipid phosphatase
MKRYATVLLVTTSVTAGQAFTSSSAFAQTQPDQVVAAAASESSPSLRPESPTLRKLFADTANDFRRLPSWESATILSIGAVGAAVSRPFDADATRSLSTSRSMASVFTAGQTIGAAHTQAAAAVATYAIGRLTHHPKLTAVGADLISAQIVSQTTTHAIKFAAGRTRPDGTSYSFPSGHTASAFATATVLQRNFGWKAGIPAYGLATYVGTSRVQMKRHFLSDVAFGAAVGVVAGRSVTIGHGDGRFALAPSAVPGVGAVSFIWMGQR